ncbi:hypothetical protein [Ralstonia pseudosolanacearum]|uniref:Probable transmembrane protein n=1 Tax=Ralstonia nicotianae (strain ATCC BAA-1114 / GMI1000) TaxID=267608 RepID=Q8XY53_RALN1|nr:hypothetical protein [Ralstonia pseudosolanacearum]MCQ4681209.1 hypothetical protein [Ralstonia pseudosolanacearum]MDC6285865.1 hypothetical protein [Ralstonia pseudosolanacearum]CAD15612.1 probable transmembrane protein [Ralstonia pseudosolanacearum GMI1000]
MEYRFYRLIFHARQLKSVKITNCEVYEMKAAFPKAIASIITAAVVGISNPVLAEASKKEQPSEKQADYGLVFFNSTASDITLTVTASQCMYDTGPSSFVVKAYKTWDVKLSDKNSGLSCWNGWKNVMWSLSTGGTLEWRHEIQASSWSTQIKGDAKSATCDNVDCLYPNSVGNDNTTPINIVL